MISVNRCLFRFCSLGESRVKKIRKTTKKNIIVEMSEKEKPRDHIINIENIFFFNQNKVKRRVVEIREITRDLKLILYKENEERVIISA